MTNSPSSSTFEVSSKNKHKNKTKSYVTSPTANLMKSTVLQRHQLAESEDYSNPHFNTDKKKNFTR